MLLTLALPRINEYMTTAKITNVYAAEGAALVPGAKLLDLRVDLSGRVESGGDPVAGGLGVAHQKILPTGLGYDGPRDPRYARHGGTSPGDSTSECPGRCPSRTEPSESYLFA